MIKRLSVFLLLLGVAGAARAAELKDDGWIFGIAGGLGVPYGPAKSKVGGASILGGQAIYNRRKEWSVGVQIDRVQFKPKASSQADMSAVLAVLRGNVGSDYEKALPYALLGAGYSESRADIAAGGTDRGSGPAFCLGLGLDYPVFGPVSLAGEFKIQRMSAPLGRLGLSGATVFGLLFRLNFFWNPGGDPFEGAPRE